MTNRTRTDSLLLAGFCAFLFLYGLGQFGLIGADEPRYAQVAREMLERHDWITPVLGGRPWLEKPPLYYWQAMLTYSIFGVSDWAARLPSALDAYSAGTGGLLFSAPLPAWICTRWRADRGFFGGHCRLCARCLHGHGAGRGFQHWIARLVGMAGERKAKFTSPSFMASWLSGCWRRVRWRRFSARW